MPKNNEYMDHLDDHYISLRNKQHKGYATSKEIHHIVDRLTNLEYILVLFASYFSSSFPTCIRESIVPIKH